MSRLDDVIKQVKATRHTAWIYDDNGNIKDEVITCDVLKFLEDLREFEPTNRNLKNK